MEEGSQFGRSNWGVVLNSGVRDSEASSTCWCFLLTRKTAVDKIEGEGTYSGGGPSHNFTWWAQRGERKGISGITK